MPGYKNEDEKDLARTATFSATSSLPGCDASKVKDGISRKLGDDMHAWVSGEIASEDEILTMSFNKATAISELRFTFHSDFNYPIRVTMAPNRQKQQRIGVPEELVKDYDVIFLKGGAETGRLEIRDNHLRHRVHRFEKTVCDTVMLSVKSTNGAKRATVFEIRAYE